MQFHVIDVRIIKKYLSETKILMGRGTMGRGTMGRGTMGRGTMGRGTDTCPTANGSMNE